MNSENSEKAPQEVPEEQVESTEESRNDDSSDYGSDHQIAYPKLIQKFGVWPVNIGLFFFYNNVISIVVLIFGLLIMYNTGVTDQSMISEKLGGLSVISSLITLGLTLIYNKKFYFTKY